MNVNVPPIDTDKPLTLKQAGELQTRLLDPFYPRFWKDRVNEDLGICRGIFVCDMSDLFGIGIPEEWTREVLDRIKRSSHRNRYYLLTKQPQNLIKFSPFPDNCFIGVTVTEKNKLLPALDALDDIQCELRYLSLEPLLGDFHIPDLDILLGGTLNWLIIGACTGSQKELLALAEGIAIKQGKTVSDFSLMPYGKQWTLQPQIEWVEEIVKAADRAGIPIFLKNNLLETEFAFNKEGYYRQEMPE